MSSSSTAVSTLFLLLAAPFLLAQTVDAFEPPENPFLAASPWPMTHRNPYNQASTPWPGPEASSEFAVDSSIEGVGPVTLVWSNLYPNLRRAVWGSALTRVFKAVRLLNGRYEVVSEWEDPPVGALVSGVYTLMDRDGNFFQPKGREIRRFADRFPGWLRSPMTEPERFVLPDDAAPADDLIVAMNLTYDGWLAFATQQGVVGVASRDFQSLHTVSLGQAEQVSNSIAVDELGGIYVVTESRMHRVQWTGAMLTRDPVMGAWSVDYEAGPATPAPGRLGPGSGTTPTLMGAGDQDRFVVIADGQTKMNLVLFWRDEIPADWPGLPGKDRRVAAEVPITFGIPGADVAVTEQSVTVRGYDAMVVSNTYNWPFSQGALAQLVILFSAVPGVQPFGVEKFRWNPQSRELESVWAQPNVSVPNGIPSMSAATGLAYVWTARNGVWGLSGLDWETGSEAFRWPLGTKADWNSAYAGTEIGPRGVIATGSLGGPVFLSPR